MNIKAPIYLDWEAEHIISIEKYIEEDAFQSRTTSQGAGPVETWKFPLGHDDSKIMNLELYITYRNNVLTDEKFVVLHGRIGNRPDLPFAHYDLQNSRHSNPSWHPPPVIAPNTPHGHRYTEKAMREYGNALKCADILDGFDDPLTPTQIWKRILNRFLSDMNIRFANRDAHGTLFEQR